MKRTLTSLLIFFLTLVLFVPFTLPISVSAASAMPDNTVIVTQKSLTDEFVFTFSGTTYTAKKNVTVFGTLTEALAALRPGGTIWLDAGTYTEAFFINKDVTILGPHAGVDPNKRGASPTDDWARNPARGTDEAILTTSWHMGINATKNEVYDCHSITVDGITVSGAGMFRSNLGLAGNIELIYRNILVTGYTTANNGPFYCYSYYPDRAANLYLRNVTAENIRFEGQTTAPGFNLTVENFKAYGIYFDEKSTAKCIGFVTVADSSASKGDVGVSVYDSMFRQKTNQILNLNFNSSSGGHNFNKSLSARGSVTATVEGCFFVNNDSAAASNNNIIVPQIDTNNVSFVIKGNYFVQTSPAASTNLIAIHGATSKLALGQKFTIADNRFVGIPTALSIPNSTDKFDLSGNYFASASGVASKPVGGENSDAGWWYLDEKLTQKSDSVDDKLDGVPAAGVVDEDKKTLTDSVNTDTYRFAVSTSAYNTFAVFADSALTKPLSETVHLTKEDSVFYLKISSPSGKLTRVYKASIHTSAPDLLAYDLSSEVLFTGRTYSDGENYSFNWSGSGFAFRFKGSGASATIRSNAPGGSNTAYIKIYVDDVEMPDVALTSTTQKVVLAKGLDVNAEHTVRVVKRTNARSSTAAVSELRITDGVKLAPPSEAPRLIEFIGDSLTVGYVAANAQATAWSTATEDVTKTYVTQIADFFGADYMVTAISGRGVVRNTDGSTDKLLPAIYPYLDAYNAPGVEYDFARKPDVVVINLGTNDASGSNTSLTAAEFKDGFTTFLKDVRRYNPDAQILVAYGLTTVKYATDMQSAVRTLNDAGDKKVSFIKLPVCSASEKAVGHPIASAYTSRGDAIIDKLKDMTGWTDKPDAPAPSDTSTPTDTDDPSGPDIGWDIDTDGRKSENTTAPTDNIDATADTLPPDISPKKGCSSTVTVTAAASTALAATACAAALKKKKEE